MDDKSILDWLQEHLTDFRETLEERFDDDGTKYFLYEMGWMDDEAHPHRTKGKSLRDCVLIATNKAS